MTQSSQAQLHTRSTQRGKRLRLVAVSCPAIMGKSVAIGYVGFDRQSWPMPTLTTTAKASDAVSNPTERTSGEFDDARRITSSLIVEQATQPAREPLQPKSSQRRITSTRSTCAQRERRLGSRTIAVKSDA